MASASTPSTPVLSNWAVPGKPVLGVGESMDLLVGARIVVDTTTQTAPFTIEIEEGVHA